MEKTICVTGGAGFIGSHLVDRLVKEKYRVVVIDDLSTGKKENINSKAKFYNIDIRDAKISQIFQKEKPEIVFHFASQIDVRKSVEDPVVDAGINILGGLVILENCRKYNVKKIIFSSSGGTIYGAAKSIPTAEDSPEVPLSPYGVSKLAVEKYLNYYYKIFGLKFVSLRFANVYGPRQNPKGEAGVIAIFCDKILSKKDVIINGDGKQTRDFVFVDDVVEANALAMEAGGVGIFNVGTAKETDINTIFRTIRNFTKLNCEERHSPANPGELRRSSLNIARIKKYFGWQPKYNLEKGLEETIDWFKNINYKS